MSAAPPAGDFGDLTGVCGPGTGTPVPSSARGVTDDEIQIGVLNDATNTIVPGLGAVYPVVAQAFADWCNEAGGINGRQITFVSRDAQLTDAAARIIDACQSDFMLVGGTAAFDATTVEPRLECGLGAVPAYTASPEAGAADLQAIATRLTGDEVNIAAFRLLADDYGDALQRSGMLAVDVPSLLSGSLMVQAAAPAAGVNITSFQRVPPTADNFRTFIQPLVGETDALINSVVTVDLLRAIKDVGYAPALMVDPVGSTYGQSLIDGLADTQLEVPFFLAQTIFPLEMADQNPATQMMLDLTTATGTDLAVDAGIVPAWSAWLLFAQAASACTDELTPECVIGNAAAQTTYTAGGLIAPVDVSDPFAIGACRVIISASADGFRYEEELTQPTDGIFNCDPANLVPTSG